MSDVNAIYVQQAQEAANAAELAANNASAMYTEIVEHDLPSIQASKEAIRTAIAGKGADIDASVPFSEYANKIDSIGADATATAADVLTGKTFLGANGNETGSMPIVTPVLSKGTLTVAKGAVTEEYTKNSVYDTSDVSTSTSNVRSGYPFYTKNGKQTGNMPDRSISEPTISVNEYGEITATVSTSNGYYNSNTVTGYSYLSTIPGQTYTPTTYDQQIYPGYYITGLITILGDSNLIAENIKKGVTIFGITGTHEGSSTPDTPDTPDTPSDVVFTVSGITSPADANGGYVMTDTTSQGKPVYKHESKEYYIQRPPSYGNVWVLWNALGDISPGDAYFYSMNDSVEGTWENSSAGSGTMVVTMGAGGGGSSDVVFTFSGSSNGSVNGDFVQTPETAGQTGKNASYTNGNVYVWYASSFNCWFCTNVLGDATSGPPLHASNGTGDDPWSVPDGWSGVTCTKAGSGGGGGEEGGTTKFTISGCYTVTDVNTTYTLTSGSGKSAVYTAENGCKVLTENDSWVVKHPMGGNILFAWDDSYSPITNVDNPWEISMWYDNDAGSRYTITFSDVVIGGGGGSEAGDTVFSVTGFSGSAEGANGDYWQTAETASKTETYAVYTNGSYYFFHNNPSDPYAYWYVSPKAGDTSNAIAFCSSMMKMNPWEGTYYDTLDMMGGYSLTFTMGGSGGSGDDSADIPANGFKVTGVTSPASLNGVYSLTSGDISNLSSCQWTNENGGHLKYFSGGYWIFGDSTSPANTPGDCFYYGQGMDKKPWEITSWGDGSYSHSGTLVLTGAGSSSGGGDYTTFTVDGIKSYGELNGTYNRTSGSGKNAVYTIAGGGTCSYNAGLSQWQFSSAAGSVAIAATADAENPWDVARWWDDNTMSEPTIKFSNMA